jgi:hypothetical protein
LKIARERIKEFGRNAKAKSIEQALTTLFSTWPQNDDLSEIHLKVVTLNAMYSTQIYDTFSAAAHILGLRVDSDLSVGELSLVERIARMSTGGQLRFNLSFASKYCSWHNPDEYPIFDSYVEDALWHFRRTHGFASFRRKDLREYRVFIDVLDSFSKAFGLEVLSRKELDQYLWMEGAALRAA